MISLGDEPYVPTKCNKSLVRTAMNVSSGNTGISVLGDLTWGSHFCLFYETAEDLLDILGPYFKAGLEHNEFCLWIAPEFLTKDEAFVALRRGLPDLDRYLAEGRMELVACDKWYLESGTFDPERVIERFTDKTRQAIATGYAGMRVNGSDAWLLQRNAGQFSKYEREADHLIAKDRMIVMCSFPLHQVGAEEIVDVVRTHQFTVVRRQGVWETIKIGEAPIGSHSLTPREREVLGWVAQGKSTRDISEILSIAGRTVDEHVKSAGRKLGAANRTHAVAIALRERIVGK
jgi:DNA-binding CsgD family transcriptional regulator